MNNAAILNARIANLSTDRLFQLTSQYLHRGDFKAADYYLQFLATRTDNKDKLCFASFYGKFTKKQAWHLDGMIGRVNTATEA